MVRGKPTFGGIADDVRAALGAGPLVAHNASFDEAFLRHAYARLGQKLTNQKLCTLRLARRLLPRLPTYRLDALTSYFGIKNKGRHRALGDAEAVAGLAPHTRFAAIWEVVAAEPGAGTQARNRGGVSQG